MGDRRISFEPLMWPFGVIVLFDEFLDEPVKMSVVEGNDVVQQLSRRRVPKKRSTNGFDNTVECTLW